MDKVTLTCSFCREKKKAGSSQVGVANEFETPIILCEDCAHKLSGFYVIFCGKCNSHIGLEWDAVIARAHSRKLFLEVLFLEVLRDNCGKREMIFMDVVYGCPQCEEGNPWAIFHGMKKGGK